ncbi:MAG: thioredoxin family protein [Paracoccaceae bacterium]
MEHLGRLSGSHIDKTCFQPLHLASSAKAASRVTGKRAEITAYGVMSMLALVVDNNLLLAGKVLSAVEFGRLL